MSVLVDTGVLYAEHDRDASRHDVAMDALDAVYDGELGRPYVSEYVYDEAITLTLQRGGSHEAARLLGQRLRGTGQFPHAYELLRVSQAAFETAVELFERYDDQRLSFTDTTQIAQLRREDIDRLLSFDDDFDGLAERLDPAELS